MSLDHTPLDWPYISDTSTRPPESCIFSQLVNLGALLLAVTFYVRFSEVREYCSSYQLQRTFSVLNSLSLLAGWSGALGLSVIANFQVDNSRLCCDCDN